MVFTRNTSSLTVFLQLASYRINHNFGPGLPFHGFDVNMVANLVNQVAKAMQPCTDVAGMNFAQQAASIIRFLDSPLQQNCMTETQRTSLSLPLIGTIRISRRPYPKVYPSQGQGGPSTMVTNIRPQSSIDEAALSNAGVACASQSDPGAHDVMESIDSFCVINEVS